MKTLKTLLKDFLWKRQSIIKNPDNPNTNDPNEINNTKNPKNLKNLNKHETTTDESPGDARMASSDTPEDCANLETPPRPAPSGEGVSYSDKKSLHDGSDLEGETEAFKRGVIEGRNQQIEERFFPKTDDGIPHFHGGTPANLPGDDIFSLAREA